MYFVGPPVMSPFSFPANSQEGSRAQVTCSVTSGDLPIYISWLKDGEPLPSSLRVSIISLYKVQFYTKKIFVNFPLRSL